MSTNVIVETTDHPAKVVVVTVYDTEDSKSRSRTVRTLGPKSSEAFTVTEHTTLTVTEPPNLEI